MTDLVKALVLGMVAFAGAHVYQNGLPDGIKPTPAVVVPGGDGSLAKLVDAESAAKLQAFYAAFADVVAAGGCETTGDFRKAQQHAAAALQATINTSGWAAVNQAVSDRINAAVGLEDANLDTAKRAALVASLRTISADFGG